MKAEGNHFLYLSNLKSFMPNQNGLPIKPPSPPDARTLPSSTGIHGPSTVRVQSYPGPMLYSYVKSVRKELKYKNSEEKEVELKESDAVKRMIEYCYHHHADFLKFWNK